MMRSVCLAAGWLAATPLLWAEAPPVAPATDTVVARATAAGKLHSCHVDGLVQEARCGTLPVWEDRTAKTGRKIDINIVVVPATDPHPAADPIFNLAGGPGEGATDTVIGASTIPGLNRLHDLVFIDQRGTGKSNPLRCPFYGRTEAGKDADMKLAAGEVWPLETVRLCKEQLEKVANLKLYTSALGIDDFNEVRTWLGYGKVDLFGGSYGTRAAQVYMHRHPDSVRAVILDGVAPLDEVLPLHHAYAGKRAMDILLKECESDASCHAAFPKVREELNAVLERVDKHPTVKIKDPKNGELVDVVASRGLVAEGFRFQSYGSGARQVPLAIHHAYSGDLAPLISLAVQRRLDLDDLLAMGMLFSVTCAEDLPYITDSAAREAVKGTLLGDYRIAQQKAVCTVWPRGEVPADVHEPVHSTVPVLLFSGERDPVTPPEFGDRVAKNLPNSLHIVVPRGSHGVSGPCASNIMVKFMDSGSVKNLPTACIAEAEPTPFQLRERVAIKVDPAALEPFAGPYQLDDGSRVLVARDHDHLVLSSEGGANPAPLACEGEGKFFSDAFDLGVEFGHTTDGKAISIVIHAGGQDLKGHHIS
jgi:pimeloyl-ACP methyl ester carboxylesterase